MPEGITFVKADLEDGNPWPFEGQRFGGIVVTNYLHRPLLPVLAQSLAEEGVLIYETFMAGNEKFGKPSNPNFLLRPGELLQAFAGLAVVAFEQGDDATRRWCSASASSGARWEALEFPHDYRQPGRDRHPHARGRCVSTSRASSS